MKTMAVLALLGAAACGSGLGGTSPGGGSGTLRVEASVSASEAVDNANSSTGFSTGFSVRVYRAGAPLSGARVMVTSPAGMLTLPESSEAGRYRGEQGGYHRTYALAVDLGADRLDAQLVGPPAHAFTSPVARIVHPAGEPLMVAWSPMGAPAASIETREMDDTATPDDGAYTIPGSFLVGRPGELRDDRIRVRRAEEIALAGGTPGSTLSVSVRNQLTFDIDGR
jgi:hypothetical protein